MDRWCDRVSQFRFQSLASMFFFQRMEPSNVNQTRSKIKLNPNRPNPIVGQWTSRTWRPATLVRWRRRAPSCGTPSSDVWPRFGATFWTPRRGHRCTASSSPYATFCDRCAAPSRLLRVQKTLAQALIALAVPTFQLDDSCFYTWRRT